jgi:hypothetical protein
MSAPVVVAEGGSDSETPEPVLTKEEQVKTEQFKDELNDPVSA